MEGEGDYVGGVLWDNGSQRSSVKGEWVTKRRVVAIRIGSDGGENKEDTVGYSGV